jgi:PGF-CTERM protein
MIRYYNSTKWSCAYWNLEEVVEPTPEEETPGFEAIFAIAGLLAVAYLLRRK